MEKNENLLTEFEVGSVDVVEEYTSAGHVIHVEGENIGADINIHPDDGKISFTVHSWDRIRARLARDEVEGILSEAVIKNDYKELAKKIAEELSELDGRRKMPTN